MRHAKGNNNGRRADALNRLPQSSCGTTLCALQGYARAAAEFCEFVSAGGIANLKAVQLLSIDEYRSHFEVQQSISDWFLKVKRRMCRFYDSKFMVYFGAIF